MAINYIKKYRDVLEINHMSVYERQNSLRAIFDRDIANKENFSFRKKIIRPLKKEDIIDIESLFSHLTHKTEDERDKKGRIIKKRDLFDFERSKRIHWISPHIDEKIKDDIKIFSSNHRQNGKNQIRTYIYNVTEDYIIVLHPQRSGTDYYFITAYYLEKKYGGPKSIKIKYKNRLAEVY